MVGQQGNENLSLGNIKHCCNNKSEGTEWDLDM